MDGTPDHISQLNKMHNCAAVVFEFEELMVTGAKEARYRVVPSSLPNDHSKVTCFYKGFMDKNAKKKKKE